MSEDYFSDAMDYSLFTIIYRFTVSYPLVSGIAIFGAVYAIFLLPCGIFFLGKQWKRALWQSCFSVGAAVGVNALIGFMYVRARPFVDHPTIVQLIHKSADKSFPSDHTAIAFAIATALFFFDRRVGYAAFAIALFIGVGRIAVGVHYPSDVFMGMFVGLSVATVVHRLFIFYRI